MNKQNRLPTEFDYGQAYKELRLLIIQRFALWNQSYCESDIEDVFQEVLRRAIDPKNVDWDGESSFIRYLGSFVNTVIGNRAKKKKPVDAPEFVKDQITAQNSNENIKTHDSFMDVQRLMDNKMKEKPDDIVEMLFDLECEGIIKAKDQIEFFDQLTEPEVRAARRRLRRHYMGVAAQLTESNV